MTLAGWYERPAPWQVSQETPATGSAGLERCSSREWQERHIGLLRCSGVSESVAWACGLFDQISNACAWHGRQLTGPTKSEAAKAAGVKKSTRATKRIGRSRSPISEAGSQATRCDACGHENGCARRSIAAWLQCESDEGLRSHGQHRNRQEHGCKPLRRKRRADHRCRPRGAGRRRQGLRRPAGNRGTVPRRPRSPRLARTQGARGSRVRRRAGAPRVEYDPPSAHRPGSEEPARAVRRPGTRPRHLRGRAHRRKRPGAWSRWPHRRDRPHRRAVAAFSSARRPLRAGRAGAHRSPIAAVREGGEGRLRDRERGAAGALAGAGVASARQAARRLHAEGDVNGHVLVTGYPRLLARRLAESFRARRPQGRVSVLANEKHAEAAARVARGISAEVLVGDISSLHLGLSTGEYRDAVHTVTDVLHAAEWSFLGATLTEMRRVNVEGTRAALDLAADCRQLRRFTHFSTVYVSGDREGVIAEDELACGQAFRNAFERTKFEAEVLARSAMSTLPCTVLRPSILVGDTKTGEIDRFEGPYVVAILLVTSPLQVAG